MGALTDQARDVFRDFVTDGVPASGPNEPAKADIRGLMQAYDIAMASLATGLLSIGAVTYPTLAALNADLSHPANTLGFVFDDSTDTNNGIYSKSGASGSGSWALTDLALPSSFSGDLGALVTEVANKVDTGSAASLSALAISNGDLFISRQDSAFGYITRPNVAGYKNLAAAVNGGGPLDNFNVNATASLFTGSIASPLLWSTTAPSTTIGGRIPFDRTATSPVSGAQAVPDRTLIPIALIQGSTAAPITTDAYLRPLGYLERHVAGQLTYEQSPDSNMLLAPTFFVNTFAEAGSSNAAAGIHSRVNSLTTAGSTPTSTDPAVSAGALSGSVNLLCAYVGSVVLAAPTGTANRAGWAANYEVCWNSGNNPLNMVGIEVDIINTGGSASGALPGVNDNYTAFWAQTAPRNASLSTPKYATAGFMVTDAGGDGMGWAYGAVLNSRFKSWALWINNGLNAAAASGIFYNSVRQNADSNLLLLAVNSNVNFGVTNEATNPIVFRVNGVLQRMTVKQFSTLASSDLVVVAA